jgi:hypothetical protein
MPAAWKLDCTNVEPRLRPCGLAIYDVGNQTCRRAWQFDEPPGTIMSLGKRYVLSLYRHPKMIDLTTGKQGHGSLVN